MQANTKRVRDSQNLQFGCNFKINLPRDYHFLTLEQKCCLSRSTLLNKKLLLGLIVNKQSLLCKAKLIYFLKIKTTSIHFIYCSFCSALIIFQV